MFVISLKRQALWRKFRSFCKSSSFEFPSFHFPPSSNSIFTVLPLHPLPRYPLNPSPFPPPPPQTMVKVCNLTLNDSPNPLWHYEYPQAVVGAKYNQCNVILLTGRQGGGEREFCDYHLSQTYSIQIQTYIYSKHNLFNYMYMSIEQKKVPNLQIFYKSNVTK